MYTKSQSVILAAGIYVLAGCGQVRFSGSAPARVVKRESTDGVSAPTVAKSQDKSYEIVDFKLSLLDAPQVKISRLEIFNGRLYVLLQCESKLPDGERCSMGGERRETFALGDIHVRLLEVSGDRSLLAQLTYDLLGSLDFSAGNVSRPVGSGEGIELGPLSIPPLVGSQRFVVIARQVSRIDNVEYETFRIFSPTE